MLLSSCRPQRRWPPSTAPSHTSDQEPRWDRPTAVRPLSGVRDAASLTNLFQAAVASAQYANNISRLHPPTARHGSCPCFLFRSPTVHCNYFHRACLPPSAVPRRPRLPGAAPPSSLRSPTRFYPLGMAVWLTHRPVLLRKLAVLYWWRGAVSNGTVPPHTRLSFLVRPALADKATTAEPGGNKFVIS